MLKEKYKILYIPVEIGARELESKLLLALKGLQKNFKIILGRKSPLISLLKHSPPGVFLSIWGAHKNFKQTFSEIRKSGHVIAAMDEEGLITLSDNSYVRIKLDQGTLDMIDVFFTWGRVQQEKFKKARNSNYQKFIMAGNPRMELLSSIFDPLYEDEIYQIKSRLGSFLLIVSSFGFANHFDGSEIYFNNLKSSGVIRDKREEDIFKEYLEFQKKNFHGFIELTQALAERFPKLNIVYRKHPAENPDILKKYFQQHRNIIIESSNSIVPWIKASTLVIHNYCTSALEAKLSGIQTLAYRPFTNENIEYELPYLYSQSFDSKDGIIMACQAIIDSKFKKDTGDVSKISEYIYGAFNHPLSSNTIINSLDEIAPTVTSVPRSYHKISEMIRNFFRYFLSNDGSYVMHKFSGVNKSLILKKITKISEIVEFNKEIEVKKISNDIFLIDVKRPRKYSET